MELIYQGATGAANIEFEDLDIGIKLPEDQQHNPKSPSRDDLIIIHEMPINGFPKITPIHESNNNPYADQSEDFNDKYLLKELQDSIEKQEEEEKRVL